MKTQQQRIRELELEIRTIRSDMATTIDAAASKLSLAARQYLLFSAIRSIVRVQLRATDIYSAGEIKAMTREIRNAYDIAERASQNTQTD